MNNDNFMNALKKEDSFKFTENGNIASKITFDDLLDFFAVMGAMRSRSKDDVKVMFEKAYNEDSLLALKALFYLRNCRGGLGERETARTIFNHLADEHSADILVNFDNIAKFGRWDDFYSFVGTHLEKYAFDFMHDVYKQDLEYLKNDELTKLSLLGKWLKSVNTSSKESKKLGRLTTKYFGESESTYRKNLSALRKALDVVERKMSNKEWSDIDYEKLPSYAAMRYRNAFIKNDEERYNDYISKVSSGTSKINAATLYPYDIVSKYWGKSSNVDKTLEEQWKALPNYVTNNKKFLIMADVSGSMYGTPMDISVSLAIYFAQRNTGPYHNKFLTFSERPTFVELLENSSLASNVNLVSRSNWGMNTDLRAAMDLVLNAAVNNNLKQEDLPDALVVITDMEIDGAVYDRTNNSRQLFTDEIKEKFAAAGYKMPTIVWWNVHARQNTFHASKDDNVRFISGASAAVFKSLCEKMGTSALELMLDTLNDDLYNCVKVASVK